MLYRTLALAAPACCTQTGSGPESPLESSGNGWNLIENCESKKVHDTNAFSAFPVKKARRAPHLAIEKYEDKIEELSAYLDGKLDNCFRNGNNSNLIDWYLKICTDEDYAEIAKKAADYLDGLTIMESDKQKMEVSRQIKHANGKQKTSV